MSIPKVMGVETEFRFDVRGAAETKELAWFCGKLIEETGGMFYSKPSFAIDKDNIESIKEEIRKLTKRDNLNPNNIFPLLRQEGFTGFYLPNGTRVYLENSYVPEASTPECLSARDLVVWEKAAERMFSLAAAKLSERHGKEVIIYKNNSDGFSHAYGGHENYLLSPRIFYTLIDKNSSLRLNPIQEIWLSFIITRQIFAGSGKVGAENNRPFSLYQLSQRTDFFETLIGEQTTKERPLINTRDRPYADPKRFKRFHVIFGDSNMSELSSFLKVGTAAIVLAMLEDNFCFQKTGFGQKILPMLSNPIEAAISVSRDLSCKNSLLLKNSDQVNPINIQKIFLETAMDWYENSYKQNNNPNQSTEEVLSAWQNVLSLLEDDPDKLNDQIDNRIKLSLINAYLKKNKCSLENSLNKEIKIPDAGGKIKKATIFERLCVLDLAYHDIGANGIYRKLLESGKIKRISGENDIQNAIFNPPKNTRAYFRGEIIRKFAQDIRWANWRKIIGSDHSEISLDDPLLYPKEMADKIISSATSFSDLSRFR